MKQRDNGRHLRIGSLLRRGREAYEDIPIPDELDGAVQEAIRRSRRGKIPGEADSRRGGFGWWRTAICAAACLCVVFVAVLNAVPVWAQELSTVPVIGEMARVFTFGRFEEQNEESYVRVEIPALENTGNTALEQRVNYEVSMKIQEKLAASKQRAKDYYEAYLATGGTAEEFMPIEILVDYTVTCNNGEYVSFIVTESESAACYYSQSTYYNIDLETGQTLTLEKLLGEGWIPWANEVIREEIARREAADENQMFFHDELEFTSIQPDQNFYLNEEGRVVVVFEKYAIAPGYMGEPTFLLDRTSPSIGQKGG